MKTKHKIISVLTILAIVAALFVVVATPASAVITVTGSPAAGYRLGAATGATATWSATQAHSGTYSARLIQGTTADSTYVDFVPNPGVTLADLTSIATGWSFEHFTAASLANWAQLELRFTAATNTDPGGAGHVDVTLMALQAHTGSGAWATQTVVAASTNAIFYGNRLTDGVAFSNSTTGMTLAQVVPLIETADTTTTTTGTWKLTRVRVELYEAGARTCYIDDVTIAGTLYDLEPTVTVTQTPATASSVAGYTIVFGAQNAVPAGGTVVVTFPSQVTLPATLSRSLIALTGVAFNLIGDPDPLVSGQQVIITMPPAGGLAAGVSTLTISQAAGIKNPAIAKTKVSAAYPVTVATSADTTTGTGYIGVIPSYAISSATGARGVPVTVTGVGWTPNSSIVITGGLSNAVTGGISLADGTFTVSAYPGTSGAVCVTDGAGQTYLGGIVVWDYTVTVRTFTITPRVTITPTSGNVGTTVTIQGFDFTSTGNIPINGITMGGVALGPAAAITLSTIDANGVTDDFVTTVTVPATMPGGAKTVLVTDSGALTATGTFTVNMPTIIVNPVSGEPNTMVTISGTNFQAADTIGIAGAAGVWFGNPVVGTRLNTTAITIDAAGGWSLSVRVPAAAVVGSIAVVAYSTLGTVGSYGFIVGGRALTITPASGPIGSTVVVTGSNMTAGVGVTIPIGALTFAGVAWNTAAITIDTLGNLSPTTLTVPAGTTGPKTVVATDSGTRVATGAFTITQPKISISPTTGYMGDTITVTGSGWVPGLLGLATIRFAGATMVLATPDASGAFMGVLTVPATAAATNAVAALDTPGNVAPSVTFVLAPASVTLSPTSGPVTSQVTVTGKGFLPQSGLAGLTIGLVPVLPITPVVTSTLGAFSATFTVPGLAAGAHTVAVTVGLTAVNVFFTITAAAASAQNQLSGISTQVVRVWGLSAGTWTMYDPADTVGTDLASLTAGQGYFIKVSNACTLIYGGFTYTLVAGWNLIGWR